MTDQEAFEAWRLAHMKESMCAENIWNAALAYLRSQGEPVAHGVGPGDWTYTLSAPVRVGTKLYLAPVAKVPEGWRLVPVEPTPEMWSAGVSAFTTKANRYEMAKTAGEGCAIADVAPDDIYRAMLAAAPEPHK